MKAQAVILMGFLSWVAPAGQESAEPRCLPSDDASIMLLSYALALATESDPEIVATRDHYQILPVPPSEVERVTDADTCERAAEAFRESAGYDGPPRPVHVIRIGTRYLAFDPNEEDPTSEFRLHVIFDEEFSELARFAA